MGNAAFTYDLHLTTGTLYDSGGGASTHWILVDGDGTRLDFGVSSGAPTPGPGIFSTFTGDMTGNHILIL